MREKGESVAVGSTGGGESPERRRLSSEKVGKKEKETFIDNFEGKGEVVNLPLHPARQGTKKKIQEGTKRGCPLGKRTKPEYQR